jgi:transglutaminase-like putative cysteine protease
VTTPTVRPSLASDTIATLMLAAFSMAVALGFARTFSAWPFLTDMLVVIAIGHGTGLALRRLRVTAWKAVPLTTIVLVWAVLAMFSADTFSWALPTNDTWQSLRVQLTSVRQEFRSAVAPVEYGGGWNVLAVIGLATSILLADVFAFRADARAEALVPGGVLFIFVGALGDERLRIATTVALVGVGVLTTVALRWYHATPERNGATMSWRRWPVAVAFGVVIAVAAGVAGPRLPGADAAPLYETSGRGGTSTQMVSPLVDIRSRLTNRSTAELFRVRADIESYWRVSALPEFDGTTWGLAERNLDAAPEAALAARSDSLIENRQQVIIGELGGTLVPAAPDPFQASGPDDLRWLPETSTLVTVDGNLTTGDTIDIVSAAPRLDAAQLASATSNNSGDRILTSVPSDLPDVVAATAQQVAGNATGSYEAAIRLQAWFQSEFEYSLEVQPGHDNSAIEGFLRDRIGYCEQFAGTYAAMMRTLGIPARVAVGFTSGVAVGDGEFSVLGRNAHAWPEVWFDDIGWVGFEPTPGRGAPNAESYTGIAPQQDTSAGAGDLDSSEVATPTTLPTGTPDDQSGLEIPDFPDQTDGATNPGATNSGSNAGGASPLLWLLAALLLTAAIAAPAVARATRRRRRAQSVDQQVADAWRRATNAVSAVGVPLRPSDTPLEVAASTARHFPLVTRPMASLAEAVTEAAYRSAGTIGFDTTGAYGASALSDCRNWAKQIDRATTETLEWPDRLRRYFFVWR